MICRRFQPEDKQPLITLLAETFDGWHGDKNEQFWAWKFEHNPHGRAQIYVAEDGERLAGCYVLMPMMLRVGDHTVPAAQAIDAAVSSAFRGRGVFTNLARMAVTEAHQDGFAILFAFPTAGSYGGQLKVGYKPTMVLPFTHRPLLWPPRPKSGGGFTIDHADTADPRFDAFRSARSDRQVRVQRDQRFLQWRYSDHPANTYKVITCERRGEICGYSVLSFGNSPGRGSPGYIVDLQVRAGERSAATLLVSHSLRELHSLGARVAVTWERPTGPEQGALRSAGFSSMFFKTSLRVKRPAFVRQMIAFQANHGDPGDGANDIDTTDAAAWSMVPGDTDYM